RGTDLKQGSKNHPRLYHAMDLLYMPLLDLQQHIKQEMLNNPCLDLEEPQVTEEETQAKDEQKVREKEKEQEEIDWEEILLDGFAAGGRRAEYEDKESYEPASVDTRDPYDHLRDQLMRMPMAPRHLLPGEEFIGNIDENGYLTCPVEDVVTGLNSWVAENGDAWEQDAGESLRPFAFEEGERMLKEIQGFDPPGIAARN